METQRTDESHDQAEDDDMKIGLLVGREETFPKAFLDRIATLGRTDVTAELCVLGGTRLGGEIPWDVIVDRISHEIPYYRVFLKEAALAGVRVINNPLRVAADDKYFGYALASQDGVAVPKTVVFPNKGYRVGLVPETFRNLAYPIDWRAHAEYVGFPAWMKPTNGRGGHDVQRVENLEQMMAVYDESGGATMMLQEDIAYDRYVRCFVFGAHEAIVTRYDPERRRYLPAEGYLEPELEDLVMRHACTISAAIGYDMNTVEFAIKNGVPYAIDFTNPCPDMEYSSLTDVYFDRVIDAMVRLAVRAGEGGRNPVIPATLAAVAGCVLPKAPSLLPTVRPTTAIVAPPIMPAVGELSAAASMAAPSAGPAPKPKKRSSKK